MRNKKTHRRPVLRDPLWGIYLGVLLLLAALVLIAGCRRTEAVTAERVSVLRDTVREVRLLRDTAHVRDSVFLSIRQQGETVYVDKERWRTEWRERVRTDTHYVHRTDTQQVFRTQVREVPRKARWWQTALEWAGAIALAAGGIYIATRTTKNTKGN